MKIAETTERLDKFLANRGIASRRALKSFVKEKEITINGKRVFEVGVRLDPARDEVKIDDKLIEKDKEVYYVLNKPMDVISTVSDEKGRRNVTDLVKSNVRIYPVGRLDKDTTGLILLTNDGELTYKLTHPKYHVPKTYRLTVQGFVRPQQLRALREGVMLVDGITQPAQVKILKDNGKHQELEMTIHEGRNRQIRRMCETLKIDLLHLQRICFGPIKLEDMKEGLFRQLSQQEVQALQKATSKEEPLRKQDVKIKIQK